jgi:hypothetical protein
MKARERNKRINGTTQFFSAPLNKINSTTKVATVATTTATITTTTATTATATKAQTGTTTARV